MIYGESGGSSNVPSSRAVLSPSSNIIALSLVSSFSPSSPSTVGLASLSVSAGSAEFPLDGGPEGIEARELPETFEASELQDNRRATDDGGRDPVSPMLCSSCSGVASSTSDSWDPLLDEKLLVDAIADEYRLPIWPKPLILFDLLGLEESGDDSDVECGEDVCRNFGTSLFSIFLDALLVRLPEWLSGTDAERCVDSGLTLLVSVESLSSVNEVEGPSVKLFLRLTILCKKKAPLPSLKLSRFSCSDPTDRLEEADEGGLGDS